MHETMGGRRWRHVCGLATGLALAAGGARGDISGAVRRADTEAPIAGARVHLQADDGVVATSAADGSFTLAVAPRFDVIITAALPYDPSAAVNFTSGGADASNGARGIVIELQPLPTTSNDGYVPIKAASPNGCGDCHADQVAQWQSSAHAGAAIDPWVLDLFSGTGTAGGGAGYVYRATHDADATGFCATCHAPVAEAHAPGSIMLDTVSDPSAREGVNCSACHTIDNVTEDVEALHLLGNATMRFPLDGVAGTQTHDFVWGPLDDVTYRFMRASYQPLFQDPRLCASCHEYENPDTHAPGQKTYEEWLASPYAVAGPNYRTCQDCHMASLDSDGVIADPPLTESLVRPATQRHTHAFVGSSADGLRAAIALSLDARLDADALVVEARVTNHGAGHSFPTGISIRNALLVVSADVAGEPLAQIDGPRVPWWADDDEPGTQDGDYAGQPGTGFAKILAGRINGSGEETMPVLFIDAERVESETNIAAGATDLTTLRFARPPAGSTVTVSARLLYRRAFRALAVTKGWTTTPSGGPIEIEVASAQRTLEAPAPACAGDCNGDGVVTVDELIAAVNIALGAAPLERCAAVNTQEDTMVSISELIAAVGAALGGCG
jgi:Cytochrome c554 and c-prime